MNFLKNRKEEKINSVTHAFGAGYAFNSFLFSNSIEVIVYSLGVVLALSLSTLYHGTDEIKTKNYFRLLDMLSIHVLIAVTCCTYMIAHSSYLFCLLSVAVLIVSVIYTIKYYGTESFEKRNVLVYIMVATISSSCAFYVLLSQSSIGLSYFIYGILFYVSGLVFYVRDGIRWFHTIWHVFVLLGIYTHLNGVVNLVGST